MGIKIAICPKCNFIADRDVIGAMNIWIRALYAYAGERGSPQSAPAMKGEPRRSRGIVDEEMKQVIKNYSKIIRSIIQTQTLC